MFNARQFCIHTELDLLEIFYKMVKYITKYQKLQLVFLLYNIQ
jgi:hypothetical protein